MLASRGSLNLTGKVTFGDAVMIGQAGSADVFLGVLHASKNSKGHARSEGDSKVAIKRLRTHLRRNKSLAKVRSRSRVESEMTTYKCLS